MPFRSIHSPALARRKAANWRKSACIQDLLLHLPLRYEDRTHLYQIGELLPGVYATVEGEVLNSNITFGGRRMMTCQISDGTGILTMRFFNFNAAMKNSLATGRRVLAYGEAKRGKYGAEMIHPEYRVQGDMSCRKR
jgi:ATP-dependent DNA helicase RecG